MFKKLILIAVLCGMLACTGTINAVVFSLASGRRGLDAESDKDLQDPEDDSTGGSDTGVREFMVKAKPKPQPLVPLPAAPKPKPQPKPRATPAPSTPAPQPTPKPTPPVTQPS